MPHHGPLRIPFGLVNAYLLQGKEGDVLIDTGLPGFSGRLLRVLRRFGSSPERLLLVVLTHVHFDHVGNLQAIRQLVQAPILVHRLEVPLLEAGRVILPVGQTPLARVVMGVGAPVARYLRFASCKPDIVVDDDLGLEDFGVAGRVLHTPGHTQGSISVLLDNGDAVVGDLCQNGWGFGMGLGRIVPPLADVPEALAPSWSRLISGGAQRLFPGHGVPFHVDLLRTKLDALLAKPSHHSLPGR